MNDVRVLVGEDESKPVIRVADQALARRRSGGDLDQVERDRSRPSVGKI